MVGVLAFRWRGFYGWVMGEVGNYDEWELRMAVQRGREAI